MFMLDQRSLCIPHQELLVQLHLGVMVLNLLNIPTSQWTDYDPSLGYCSIYNEGFVGIATTNPSFTLTNWW